MHPTFAHGTADVLFDGMDADGQCCRYLHVVCAMAKQDDDITFAIAEHLFVV
jgi:hypothetical protein